MKKRVVVALSGGVDSSVAAALLKKEGFEVIGLFLRFWKDPYAKGEADNLCCSIEALTAARQLSAQLKIPFYLIDVADYFKREVVDYYLHEYAKGRTPNPCVVCNKYIKFGYLLDLTKKLDAQYLATGHYAQIKKLRMGSGQLGIALTTSADKVKDQTYFLWMLKAQELKKILFPVGEYRKSQVVALAKKWGLRAASRRESQGICFIPDRDNAGFLTRNVRKLIKSGPIVDLSGKIIGHHQGLAFCTIGQRRSIGLGEHHPPKATRHPALYVVKLDLEHNRLVVGEKRDLYQRELVAERVSWISLSALKPGETIECQAKIRYGHKAVPCQVSFVKKDRVKVIFSQPQRAITPGQSIVFYLKDQVLGGGIIKQ